MKAGSKSKLETRGRNGRWAGWHPDVEHPSSGWLYRSGALFARIRFSATAREIQAFFSSTSTQSAKVGCRGGCQVPAASGSTLPNSCCLPVVGSK